MGTISSGVGLVSGINIQQLVTQLMAIESQPLTQLQTRVKDAQTQQGAYTDLGVQLVALQAAVQQLTLPSTFTGKTTTSSDDQVLTATAGTTTPLGKYSFVVKSVVSAEQLVSGGFADPSTKVGAGTLTLGVGQPRVDQPTPLANLNGYAGVRRGIIRITDRSGVSAQVDLRAAPDLQSVIEAINSQQGINVRARVEGDRLVVTDQSGGAGSLSISDVGGGYAARDLGIAGTSASGEVVGQKSLDYLTGETSLSVLNDGTGLRVSGLASDLRVTVKSGESFEVNLSGNLRFATKLQELNDGRGVRGDASGQRIIRITNRAGVSADVDLSSAGTLQDVADAIGSASLSVGVALSGNKVLITDSSGGTTSDLKIEDVSGHAAADLGIAGSSSTSAMSGAAIYGVDTIGAVLAAFTYAQGNDGKLTAALSTDGKGIVLKDTTTGGGPSTVEALNGSLAARDLGLLGGFTGDTLTSRHLIGGLDTVLLSSLNGGSGVRTGQVTFTRRDGDSAVVDFSGAQTLADVVDQINGLNGGGWLSAQVDAGGTGVVITDNSTGSGTLSASGVTTDDLHLSATTDGQLATGNLALQYISENTTLASLNQGHGIAYGRVRITDSDGQSATLSLVQSAQKSIGDVIDAINRLGIGVTASVNDNGDGIKLLDTAGGSGKLTVAEDGSGTTAANLHILGTSEGAVLNGSFSGRIDVAATDSLDDVVKKINNAQIGITASVMNDGTSLRPYRLVLTSNTDGTAGRIAFSTGSTSLGLDTLSEARDAAVLVGGSNATNPILITSGSNTITGVVGGLTLNLTGTSDQAVQVAVSSDPDRVVSAVQTFVSAFNDAMGEIDTLTSYNADTQAKGTLLGDSTVQNIQYNLLNTVQGAVPGLQGLLDRLGSVGIMVDSSGGQGVRLTLNRALPNNVNIDGESVLRNALAQDPNAVAKLFTLTKVVKDQNGNNTVQKLGIGVQLDDLLTQITSSSVGTLAQSKQTLQDRIDLFNQRATDMQTALNAKSQSLYTQFTNMELALANLQGQQSALASLSTLAAGTTSTASSSSKVSF